ncbi:polysaccharide deacetylase family protein [Oscillatoria sp. CS-180]|uniref:polysaccharide deacetylase family protein n=1 Tax=Oscillatoria sp. CS-180 TaxID=3021720 RepID=UPI00232F3BF5|nr:polysaccharide deacetylase family protein [Oscillatoria sp. CS-180]MDB9526216.1 polysaccharide deacetylase family protein [Oscillatoria sp. CS-180]
MTDFLQKGVEKLTALFPAAIFYKPISERMMALTIDDVPVPEASSPCPTRWILTAIAEHNQSVSNQEENVRATFFVIGSHLNEDRTLLTDLVAQGHEVANHGLIDTWPALQSKMRFTEDFRRTHDLLTEQIPSCPIRWYRPGRAFYTSQMLETVQQTEGYEPTFALASMLPLDTLPGGGNPRLTARYVAQHVFPGAILLLHGGSVARSRNTAAALRLILPNLQSQGYRVTTLSHLWDQSPDNDRSI